MSVMTLMPAWRKSSHQHLIGRTIYLACISTACWLCTSKGSRKFADVHAGSGPWRPLRWSSRPLPRAWGMMLWALIKDIILVGPWEQHIILVNVVLGTYSLQNVSRTWSPSAGGNFSRGRASNLGSLCRCLFSWRTWTSSLVPVGG